MSHSRKDFVGIPQTPEFGEPGTNYFVSALRENVELLAGLRGTPSNHAITKGAVDSQPYAQYASATPTKAEFDALVNIVNSLINNLKT